MAATWWSRSQDKDYCPRGQSLRAVEGPRERWCGLAGIPGHGVRVELVAGTRVVEPVGSTGGYWHGVTRSWRGWALMMRSGSIADADAGWCWSSDASAGCDEGVRKGPKAEAQR